MEVNTTEATVLKQPVENDKAIVVNQIIVRNIDRTMKEISTWRNAHIAAERVIWPIRQRLYDIYKDVELDGHLSGIIEKRFLAVMNKKLTFRRKDKTEVEELDTLIKSMAFRKLRRETLNTILWGVTGVEFVVGKEFAFVEVPRKHIKPEYKIIAKEQYGFEGFEYEKNPNIIVMGEPHDLGLFLKCAPYAIWKRGGFADYAQFVEIFGQPVRIFKYDAYDIKTKNEVQLIADEAGNAMSLIIPNQAQFEMMDGKTANANGDLQSKFIKALNDEMSVIILGNTETTTSSSGSGYAQSKTHGEQQMEITKSDMEYELQYLNSPKFIAILKSYGFPVDGGAFAYEQEANVAMLAERIKVDKELVNIVPISDDYFYETYHIPKPDNYDELKTKMEDDKKLQSGIEDEDQNGPAKPGDKLPKKNGKKAKDKSAKKEDTTDLSDEPGNLSQFDKWRMRLADFFAQAPRD